MAFDDPAVWIIIFVIAIFLFGSNKIPGFAKALGEARREFDNAFKGITGVQSPPPRPSSPPGAQPQYNSALNPVPNGSSVEDPLIVAARNEGIDTFGKSREQIANELAWKLGKK